MITILRDLEMEEHTLYHVSPKKFDFPCRKKINEAREWSPWHDNGVLGLWASTFPKMCAAFGKHVYRITLGEHRAIGLPFGEFQRLTSHMEDFTDLIEFLCEQGDVAYLVDANPWVGEVIVLNFDAIDQFEDVTDEELKDVRTKMISPTNEKARGRR